MSKQLIEYNLHTTVVVGFAFAEAFLYFEVASTYIPTMYQFRTYIHAVDIRIVKQGV